MLARVEPQVVPFPPVFLAWPRTRADDGRIWARASSSRRYGASAAATSTSLWKNARRSRSPVAMPNATAHCSPADATDGLDLRGQTSGARTAKKIQPRRVNPVESVTQQMLRRRGNWTKTRGKNCRPCGRQFFFARRRHSAGRAYWRCEPASSTSARCATMPSRASRARAAAISASRRAT